MAVVEVDNLKARIAANIKAGEVSTKNIDLDRVAELIVVIKKSLIIALVYKIIYIDLDLDPAQLILNIKGVFLTKLNL